MLISQDRDIHNFQQMSLVGLINTNANTILSQIRAKYYIVGL